MKLERLTVKGFKSLRDVDVELRDLNVLIGPNGAGKSNFLSLFHLLNRVMVSHLNFEVARGGGADAFLFLGGKSTDSIEVKLSFGSAGYQCVWVPSVRDDLIFASESVRSEGTGDEAPVWTSLNSGEKESQISAEIRRWGNAPGAGDPIFQALLGWKSYHFHDTGGTARVKKTGDLNDNLYLHRDASNLAAFLFRLKQTHERHYNRIVTTIRQVAPFFGDFLLRPLPENEGKIRLEWRQKDSDYPFLADQLSDGTLRFVCLATVLLQPELPSTILIDEPELGLHPHALSVLAGLLKSAARHTQVIVSTQSVTLMEQFEIE
ncbi:MAG TPA: AAA family ATPase, partial [Armatimonadota bacterium]|nr:AAA family ATPase [Armatimonadota bacterium]